MPWCKECGRFSLSGHECPPVWQVWSADEDEPEDPRKVRADDAGEAAEKWADTFDAEEDYVVMRSGGEGYEVRVRRVGSHSVKKVVVFGESSPSYTARVVA